MNPKLLFVALVLMLGLDSCGGSGTPDPAICAEQSAGVTSDGASVTVCQKLFQEAPLVRLPQDDRNSADSQVINGVIDLDLSIGEGPGEFHIGQARFIDRAKNVYVLIGKDGLPIDETNPLMQANKLPSNRAHYLLYEARGAVQAGNKLRLDALRPIVMVTGRAIDERFLGAWEGAFSVYEGDRTWSPTQSTKVRLEFTTLVPTDNIATVTANNTPPLPDGTRFKATGTVANAQRAVRLSTGECAAALTSLGEHNPLRVASNTEFTLWRFPAMHSANSSDFHVVHDYPANMYSSATGMASDHNFHIVDYIAPGTAPKELTFFLHGNPIGQFWMELTPVQGGGGSC